MYYLEKNSFVPLPLDKCWDFFSSPENLSKITPDEMDFVITSNSNLGEMYEGMMITYTVRPLWGIKISWVSEITVIKEKKYFIDEQREGPYKVWHHEHHFSAEDGGVRMTDKIYYSIPFGFIGKIANALIVKRQLKGIFDHREESISKLFGK